MKLTIIETIEYFDGPILEHVVDEKGTLYLRKWCSHTDLLLVQSTTARIKAYKDLKITMRDLLSEFNQKGIIQNVRENTFTEVDLQTLPPLYLPKEGCWHDPDLGVIPDSCSHVNKGDKDDNQ